MSKSTPAETVKVVAVEPFHEVDGAVFEVGKTYDIHPDIATSLIASGAVKAKEA